MPSRIVAGINPVSALVSAGTRPDQILVTAVASRSPDIKRIIQIATRHGIPVRTVDHETISKLTPSRHQGIAAVQQSFNYSSQEEIFAAASGRKGCVVFADGVTDPHNLGAIIRSLVCAGVSGLVIPERGACGVNETVFRTSAGAAAFALVASVKSLPFSIAEYRKAGATVYALEAGQGNGIWSTDLASGPVGLVVGSEGDGVSRDVLSACNGTVSIPQEFSIGSLNASVSCAISVFEWLRQRNASMEGSRNAKPATVGGESHRVDNSGAVKP